MTFYRFRLRLWRELRSGVLLDGHGELKRRGGSVFVACGRAPSIDWGLISSTRSVSIHTPSALLRDPPLWSASFFLLPFSPALSISSDHFLTYSISILHAWPRRATPHSNPGLCTYIDENDVRQQGVRIGYRIFLSLPSAGLRWPNEVIWSNERCWGSYAL